MAQLPESLRIQSQVRPLSAATAFDLDHFLNDRPGRGVRDNGYFQRDRSLPPQRLRHYGEDFPYPGESWPSAEIEESTASAALVPQPLFAARKASDPTSNDSKSSSHFTETPKAFVPRPVSAVRLLPSQHRNLAAQYGLPSQRTRQGRPARRPISSAIDLDFQVPPTPVTVPVMQLPFDAQPDRFQSPNDSSLVKDDEGSVHYHEEETEEKLDIHQDLSILELPLSLTALSGAASEAEDSEIISPILSVHQESSRFSTRALSPPAANKPRALSSNDLSREFSIRPNPWAEKPIAPDSSLRPSREPSLPKLARQPLSIRRKIFAQEFEERTSRSSSRSSSQTPTTRTLQQPSEFPILELPGSTTFAKDDFYTQSAASETKHAILDLYLRSPGDELEGYFFTLAPEEDSPRGMSASASNLHSPEISPTENPSGSSSYTPWHVGQDCSKELGASMVHGTNFDRGRAHPTQHTVYNEGFENAYGSKARHGRTPPPGTLSPPLSNPSPHSSPPPPPYINDVGMISPPISPPRSGRPRLYLETTLYPQNQRSRSADPVLLRGPEPMNNEKSKLQQEYKKYYAHYAEGAPPPPASLHPAFAHRNERAPPSYSEADLHAQERKRKEWDTSRQEQKRREDEHMMMQWACAARNNQQLQHQQEQRMQYYTHQAGVHPCQGSEFEDRLEAEWERSQREKGRSRDKRVARLKGTGFGVSAIEAVSAVARILS